MLPTATAPGPMWRPIAKDMFHSIRYGTGKVAVRYRFALAEAERLVRDLASSIVLSPRAVSTQHHREHRGQVVPGTVEHHAAATHDIMRYLAGQGDILHQP